MRHARAGNRLGRNSTLRKATIRDLAKATLLRQRICTTKANAKEARKMVERLITLGKKGELVQKRKAFSILCDHQLVSNLFSSIAPRFKSRMGGYTRIIPISTRRRGDNAELVYLELTEKDLTVVKKQPAESTKSKETKSSAVEQKQKKSEVSKEKKEKPAKSESTRKTPPTKDAGQDKTKSSKNIMGGIKKIFNKNPSSS